MYALNATTGAVLWTATTGGAVDSSPAVANGVVYVGSDDDKVYALNATTGAGPLDRHHRRRRRLVAGGRERGRLHRLATTARCTR